MTPHFFHNSDISNSSSVNDKIFRKKSMLEHFRALVKRRVQEGGVNLLAQLGDCAADDLSHYDVTSEPVREISMAAKR